jgi:hypothetical protein
MDVWKEYSVGCDAATPCRSVASSIGSLMTEWQGEHAAVQSRWQSTIQGMEEYQVFSYTTGNHNGCIMKSLSELGGTILHNPITHISTEGNHSALQLGSIRKRIAYHSNRNVSNIRQETIHQPSSTIQGRRTYPLTFPMICFLSRYSIPLYRVKSSWGLLSPFVSRSWVVFLFISIFHDGPLGGQRTDVICDSITLWTIGISPVPGLFVSSYEERVQQADLRLVNGNIPNLVWCTTWIR